MTSTALAVDLGSSSGRIVAGTLVGDRIDQVEVHRFEHQAKRQGRYLIWDTDEMWREVVAGLSKAVAQFPDAASVAIDTWGVDWVALDADGQRLMLPRAYRDERTTRTLETFRNRLSDEAGWAATGIAPATINTANQLFAFLQEEPELAERTKRILFLPDYFNYLLTGVLGWSRSIASTGALTRPGGSAWADEVFEALGIPRTWVGELSVEHSIIGPCTVAGLEQLTVVRAGAHDSAAVVHALQRDQDQDAYFLSSGSWSVLGVLRDEPLLGDEARQLGITNEARADTGVRPLFNITGLWILQECQRQWAASGAESDIVALVDAAQEAQSLGRLIDVDAPEFAQPGEMVARIESAVATDGQDCGTIVRLICESLAARYARGLADLARLTGQQPKQLNVVSGGSRNALLCQLTADATGVPVVAGPAEASVLGSLLAQFETMGRLKPEDRNRVIAHTAKTRRYEPRNA